VNIYLPDPLAAEVRRHNLNLSALAQQAARAALADLGVTHPKGVPMDTVSEEKRNYLAERFDAVRDKFAAHPNLSDGKARSILMSLQTIDDALESDRFAEL
jgi:hypothetical protein